MHPFCRLERDRLRQIALPLLAAWAFLTLILIWVAPGRSAQTIPELAMAGSVAVANDLLSHWSESDRLAFAFILGFDLLYDLVHNNAVAVSAVWVAAGRSPRLAAVGSWLAWLLWLATLVNVVENLAFFEMLRSGPVSPWPEFGLASTLYRNGAMMAGIGFVLIVGPGADLVARLRARRAG